MLCNKARQALLAVAASVAGTWLLVSAVGGGALETHLFISHHILDTAM